MARADSDVYKTRILKHRHVLLIFARNRSVSDPRQSLLRNTYYFCLIAKFIMARELNFNKRAAHKCTFPLTSLDGK